MLQLSGYLLDKQVLSLRIGKPVAQVSALIINPRNLKVEGFYCQDSEDRNKPLILLTQDIREMTRHGYIIDDYDALASPEDIVRLQEILHLNFTLRDKRMETVSKVRVGKVDDYAVETSTMYIQKLYVSQPIWRNLTGGTLSIDRSHIVEITDKRIVIQELLQGTPDTAAAAA